MNLNEFEQIIQQIKSNFSILNTFEQTTPSSPQTTLSRVIGMLQGVPLPQHV